MRLVHYQCFFLWRSSKQLHCIHLRQERLREYLYMALNPHIPVIKCVKDLCCELAVKHHRKLDICCHITVIRRLILYVMLYNCYMTVIKLYNSYITVIYNSCITVIYNSCITVIYNSYITYMNADICFHITVIRRLMLDILFSSTRHFYF